MASEVIGGCQRSIRLTRSVDRLGFGSPGSVDRVGSELGLIDSRPTINAPTLDLIFRSTRNAKRG
eukprot:scaffold128343_cov17-Prasinocladus_malaysianus.AAC.1